MGAGAESMRPADPAVLACQRQCGLPIGHGFEQRVANLLIALLGQLLQPLAGEGGPGAIPGLRVLRAPRTTPQRHCHAENLRCASTSRLAMAILDFMNNKITRIAIVGIGAAARSIHLPAYRGIPDLEIVGGVDPQFTADHGIRMYSSLASLIAQARPDIVTIATPPATHFALAREALESGCHVFLEKPIAPTLAEGAALVRIAQQSGRQLIVNSEFRFMSCHASAQQLIGTEEFGELRFVHLHQTFRANAVTESGWRGTESERTCTEFGIHALDLCRFFFNAEPLRLRAHMAGASGALGPDMLNLMDLDFSLGRFARITLDRLTRGRHRYLDCRLDGTRATIETEVGGALEFNCGIRSGTRRPYVNFDFSAGGRAFIYNGERRRKTASDPIDLFAAATRRLMQAVLKALAAGSTPPCNAVDNFRSFALMRAAYESARDGRDINVSQLYESATSI